MGEHGQSESTQEGNTCSEGRKENKGVGTCAWHEEYWSSQVVCRSEIGCDAQPQETDCIDRHFASLNNPR